MAQKNHPPQSEEAIATVMEPLWPIVEAALRGVENSDQILTAARTYRRTIARDMADAAKRTDIKSDSEKYWNAFLKVLPEALLHAPDMFEQSAQRISADFDSRFSAMPEYHALHKLVTTAEHISPKECESALKINQEEIFHKSALAGMLLSQVSNHSGELRAEYTIHATKRASELVYQPFMRVILHLFCVVKSKTALKFYEINYGQVLNVLKQWSFLEEYPNFLDEDAVLFRNAEAHEHWDYFSETDEMEVWDKNTEKRKRLTVENLLHRASGMVKVAGMMFPHYIQMRNCLALANLAEPLRKVLPHLLNCNK